MYSSELRDHVVDLLSSFGEITTRSMFGGCGIYRDGIIYGIIVESDLYLKGDGETEGFYRSEGSVPFTYDHNGKQVAMSYWRVPAELLDRSEALAPWAVAAWGAALRGKAGRKK